MSISSRVVRVPPRLPLARVENRPLAAPLYFSPIDRDGLLEIRCRLLSGGVGHRLNDFCVISFASMGLAAIGHAS